MDVRQFYKKIREVQGGIEEAFVFVTSLETSDGGRPGLVSEVSRELAARLLVESRVTRSLQAEIDAYRRTQQDARKAAERAELAKTIQVALIREPDRSPHDNKPGDK
jgi:hypothetical protein